MTHFSMNVITGIAQRDIQIEFSRAGGVKGNGLWVMAFSANEVEYERFLFVPIYLKPGGGSRSYEKLFYL